MYTLRTLAVLVVVLVMVGLVEAVDWTRVPAVPPEARDLNTPLLGECACDLHNGDCDVDCCCDPDCGDIEVGSTGIFKECIPARDLRSTDLCAEQNDATAIYRMNNGASLDVEDPGDQFVCIYRNNFPDRSSHYTVPSIPVTTTSATTTTDWFLSADVLSFPGFQAGDNVPLHTVSKTGLEYFLTRSSDRSLSIRGRGVADACDGAMPVPFLDAPGVQGCLPLTGEANATTTASTAAALCDEFSIPLALRAVLPPNSALTTIAGVVPITMVIFDVSTAEGLSTLSDESAAMEIFNPLQHYAKVFDGTTDSASISQTDLLSYSTFYNSTTDTCVNAAVSTLTSIFYSTESGQEYATIVNATVFVFIQNATTTVLGDLSVQETVRYVNTSMQQLGSQYSTPKAVGDDGELYPYSYATAFGVDSLARSGNPGYIKGQRVLAGTLLTNGDQEVIEQRLTGLSHPLGSCSTGPLVSVPFGHDVGASSCYVELTEAELQSMCAVSTFTEGDMSGVANLLLGVLNRSSTSDFAGLVNVIGITGDAADAATSSWVAVTNGGSQWAVSSSGTSPRFSTLERACYNVIIGLRYTVSVGRAGSPLDPQDIIVGASVEPVYGTWTYRQGSSTTNRFRFSFTTTFTRYVDASEETQQRRVIAPSVLPGVDEYVFYPFRRPRT